MWCVVIVDSSWVVQAGIGVNSIAVLCMSGLESASSSVYHSTNLKAAADSTRAHELLLLSIAW